MLLKSSDWVHTDNKELEVYFNYVLNLCEDDPDYVIPKLFNNKWLYYKYVKIDFMNGKIEWLYNNKFEILGNYKGLDIPLTELAVRIQDKLADEIIDCSLLKNAVNYKDYDILEQPVNELNSVIIIFWFLTSVEPL